VIIEEQKVDNQFDSIRDIDTKHGDFKDSSLELKEAVNLENLNSVDEFKKMASQMIGDSVDYDKPLDINTAYKLLRQMVKQPGFSTQAVESLLNRTSKKKPVNRICKLSWLFF
jgi:hypothetical protein